MSSESIFQSILKLTFIGPRVAWRVLEMAAAATQVVPARVGMLATATKKPSRAAASESFRMVSEKIIGSWESMFNTAETINGAGATIQRAAFGETQIKALSKVLASRNPVDLIVNVGAFQFGLIKTWVSFPFQVTLFWYRLFMRGSEPLHSRVTANAKRLKRSRGSKR